MRIFHNPYSLKGRPKNKLFHASNAPIKTLVCGIGFGKTTIAVNEAYNHLLIKQKESDVLICLPTYKMLNQSFIPQFRKFFPGWAFKINRNGSIFSDGVATLADAYGGRKIYFRTSNNPDLLRGLNEIGLAILDECALSDEETFDIILTRLHRPGVEDGQCELMTTPRGTMNWVSKRAIKPAATKPEQFFLIRAASYENPDFRQSDIDFYKSVYSEARFRQEIMGEEIESELVVYRDFNPSLHTCTNEQLPTTWDNIYCGVDFGLYSTAILIGEKSDIWYVIDSIVLRNRTADVLGEQMQQRWGSFADMGFQQAYVDPSGGERTQDIPLSYNADNNVEDGIDTWVSLFQHNRIKINTEMENYDEFIGQLTSYSRDEHTMRPIKKNDHMLDAARYGIHSPQTGGMPKLTVIRT